MEPRFHRDERDDRQNDGGDDIAAAARGAAHNGHTAAHADSVPAAAAAPDIESAIIEMLLRGCTPADCARELFDGSMLDLMRTIGRSPRCQQLMREAMAGQQLTRSMRLEAIKGAVTERIYDIAIGHEYAPTSGPMSQDTARAVEAQRRACVTLLRLDERGSPGRQEPVFPGDGSSSPAARASSEVARASCPCEASRNYDSNHSHGQDARATGSAHATEPHGLHTASQVRLRADHATHRLRADHATHHATRQSAISNLRFQITGPSDHQSPVPPYSLRLGGGGRASPFLPRGPCRRAA